MPSAGELLRQERLKQNRSVQEIAATTCISTRHLEAIESDDARSLPGDFFYRSFLKQYAQALYLDEATTRQVLSSVEPVSEPDPISFLHASYVTAEQDARRSGRKRPSTAVVLTLFIAVLLGCSGLYAIWNKAQAQKEEVVEKSAAAMAEGERNRLAEPPPPSVPARESSPASSPAPEAPVPPASTTGASVDVAANERTWVSLSSDGKKLFAGVLRASESKKFVIGESAKLLTGNAAALDIRLNGKPIGPIGPRGRVRMVVFTPDAYQILLPRTRKGA